MERFSLGHLTYATDKLIALSAIASEMQGHIKSEYLAGMWRQHLAYQLLWEVRGVQWLVRRGRPNEYIAPSWSWASVVGNVENACDVRFANDREIILEVLDGQVELMNAANPFGQVKSGFLRVRGSLAKGTVFIHKFKVRERVSPAVGQQRRLQHCDFGQWRRGSEGCRPGILLSPHPISAAL
jgi:hypothetical protein